MRDQLLILTSVASLFCVTASAAEWFVSPDGTDADGRGAETEPFRTINYAVGKASANDTIILLPGDHVEGITFYRGATATDTTNIADGGGGALISGDGTKVDFADCAFVECRARRGSCGLAGGWHVHRQFHQDKERMK